MIARIWRASATARGAEQYREHFAEQVLPQLREVDGFLGASLLERAAAELTEIEVITRWESLDRVREFAGDDISVSVVEPAARAVLAHSDGFVTHHRVSVEWPP
jgi:hypothetical protein